MLADQSVVALRQLLDELVGAGRSRRRLDRSRRGPEPAIGDVGAHRVVEQTDFLRDERDGAAQRGDGYQADVLAVDRNASRLDIEEPRDQVEDRRFSRTRWADEGNRAAR